MAILWRCLDLGLAAGIGALIAAAALGAAAAQELPPLPPPDRVKNDIPPAENWGDPGDRADYDIDPMWLVEIPTDPRLLENPAYTGWGLELPDVWTLFEPEIILPYGIPAWQTRNVMFAYPQIYYTPDEVPYLWFSASFQSPTAHSLLAPSYQVPGKYVGSSNYDWGVWVDLREEEILARCGYPPFPHVTEHPVPDASGATQAQRDAAAIGFDDCRNDHFSTMRGEQDLPTFLAPVLHTNILPVGRPTAPPVVHQMRNTWFSATTLPNFPQVYAENRDLDQRDLARLRETITCNGAFSYLAGIYTPHFSGRLNDAGHHHRISSLRPPLRFSAGAEQRGYHDLLPHFEASFVLVQIRRQSTPWLDRVLDFHRPEDQAMLRSQPYLHPVRFHMFLLPDGSGVIVGVERGALFAAQVLPDGSIPYLDTRPDLLRLTPDVLVPYQTYSNPELMALRTPNPYPVASAAAPVFSIPQYEVWANFPFDNSYTEDETPELCAEVMRFDLQVARTILGLE